MPKIQTSLGLTPEAKQVLSYMSLQLGLSHNEYIESLILSQVKQKVEFKTDIKEYTIKAVKNGLDSFSEIVLWESYSGSVVCQFNHCAAEELDQIVEWLRAIAVKHDQWLSKKV